MEGFNSLLALTHAAESCNGAARQFAEQYSSVPEWSHFQGGSLCQPAADSQAAQHLGHVRSDVGRMEEYIRDWDIAYDGLQYVRDAVAAMNPKPPIYSFNGQTHNTAHRAAQAFAQWMVEIYQATEGWNDREVIADLANRLRDVGPIQDFYGYIEREHDAASPLAPLDDDDEGGQNEKPSSASEAHQAHRENIFPTGEGGIDGELCAIARLIEAAAPSPERTKIARQFYKDNPNANELADSALKRIRRLENLKPPRLILPKKRTGAHRAH